MNFLNKLGNKEYSGSLDEMLDLLSNDKLSTTSTIFVGKIVKSVNFKNKNYLNLTIQIGENICDQFISLNTLSPFVIGDNIELHPKDICLNSIDGEVYIEILKANIKKNKSQNQIINDDIIPNFLIDSFKFIYAYNELELSQESDTCIYSIILKVKQVEDKDLQYEFYDIFNEKVPLDYSNITNLIEGQKIYIFHSLKLIKDSNERYHLIPMKYSSVRLLDDNHILYNDTILIRNETIVSFKGQVNKYNLEENENEINDENNKKFTIKLSNRLFKKIELGCGCYFRCFIQKDNGNLKETAFSDIISDEKTIILFKFIKGERFYNQIKIDNLLKEEKQKKI